MKITNRKAIEAQFALSSLLSMNLPIRTSFDVALLSAAIDRQVLAFSKVRDALIKNYKIKISAGEKEHSVIFTTSLGADEKEKALIEFTEKINELIESEGEDISIHIKLPLALGLKPESLKPILPFLSIEGN